MPSGRPSLLFIAPIVPAPTGNGLAMRAGVFVDALAKDYAVTLLVVPVAGGAAAVATPFIVARTAHAVVAPLDGALDPLWELSSRLREPAARVAALAAYSRPQPCRYATSRGVAAAKSAVGEAAFDRVHVMRSYLAPYAAPWLPQEGAATPVASLDLDDDEAATHAQLALLATNAGQPHEATLLAAEADKYRRHEATWLPRFPRLIAVTHAHAGQLAARHPCAEVAVVANTVVVPGAPARPAAPGGRVLFVGNLSYRPNVEGVLRFVREVWPRLRRHGDERLALRIAGAAPDDQVKALAREPAVEVVADPPDVASHYAWADLAIVPIGGGGGTRIKLLEAFAHRVPVVATPIGAEGIAAEHGTHLLLAQMPDAFAAACERLLNDVPLASAIAERARALVELRYSHPVGVAAVRAALQDASVRDR